jgi:hypothetical protein
MIMSKRIELEPLLHWKQPFHKQRFSCLAGASRMLLTHPGG